jgi:hypothetical protein
MSAMFSQERRQKMNWLKKLLGSERKDESSHSTVTVPDVWGMGEGNGKPFVLPRNPNVAEIFTQASSSERTVLPYAYLNHPEASVRLATIAEIKKFGDNYLYYCLFSQFLVDRLADASSEVRSAAAQALWTKPEAVKHAVCCLRDEIRRTGFVSTMSSQDALRGVDILGQAAPSADDFAQFKKWVVEQLEREENSLFSPKSVL